MASHKNPPAIVYGLNTTITDYTVLASNYSLSKLNPSGEIANPGTGLKECPKPRFPDGMVAG